MVAKYVTPCNFTPYKIATQAAYTATNATDVMQFADFASLIQVCRQFPSSLLSSSNCIKSVRCDLISTDLRRVVETTYIKLVDKKS